MDDRHPLLQISEEIEEQCRSSRVAIFFDLDSTLFCVSPRTQAILRTLASEQDFVSRFGTWAEILRDVEVLPTDWGVREPFERLKIQAPAEVVKHVRDYWRKHFFSSHFLEKDEMYPAANQYVRHLHELGAEIFYLTGRPEATMREGTLQALNRWGFPLISELHLLMKPSHAQRDESFKARVLSERTETFDHLWLFENEPVIIEFVRQLAPQVRIVFVNSVHSRRAEPPGDLLEIRTQDYARFITARKK